MQNITLSKVMFILLIVACWSIVTLSLFGNSSAFITGASTLNVKTQNSTSMFSVFILLIGFVVAFGYYLVNEK